MNAPSPRPARPWRPVLEGDLARAANAAIDDIAASLAPSLAPSLASPTDMASDPAGFGSSRDLSLAGGLAGVALFFSYLHFARPGRGHDDTAMTLLERAIAGTAELPVSAGLYGGFAGVAWTLEHLNGRLFDPEGEDPGEEIATVLRDYLGSSPWQSDYDLIGGLVGFGGYALERGPRPGGRECLEEIVARLAETAEERPVGISWHTPSERTGLLQRDTYPAGYYNLGVAHGVPGVIGLLGEACAAGLPAAAAGEARRLLGGACAWVLSQRLPPGAASLFPYNFAPGSEPFPTRLAWCYGDLGIAAALLAAARAAEEPDLAAEALAVARHAAARPAEGAGVVDAGLCHGAAGVAHLFNCLYQASGDEALGA
ncbi:MAG TPA: lanthionine synthetase LanC family protein, partial [Thermoanaerobaculia bacterium]|nr:lanthionine synthetase LanC family protein [Thermoanaerobaculia bacterium]